jgi:hypothetical protein
MSMMNVPAGLQGRADRGHRVVRGLLCACVVYVVGAYFYWPVLKIVGVLVLGEFHFEDRVVLIHGDAPFWSVVLLSPLTLIYHVMESLPPWPTVAFVSEYTHYPYPPYAFPIVGASLLLAFGTAAGLLRACLFFLRRIRRPKGS